MDRHSNPSRKKVSFPVCGHSQQQTPRKSLGLRNKNQLLSTKSPQCTVTSSQNKHIQEEIIRMLEENNQILGVISDLDYDIQRKNEQIQEIKSGRTIQWEEETPQLQKLLQIRHKLQSVDIQQSVAKFSLN